jgi:hypothetical protein
MAMGPGAALALGRHEHGQAGHAEPDEDRRGDPPPRGPSDPTGCHLQLHLHVDVDVPYWGVTPVTLQER